MIKFIDTVFAALVLFAPAVHATPQYSVMAATKVLADANGYLPGDTVINHGGNAVSSHGLGTWHAGVIHHGHGVDNDIAGLPPLVEDIPPYVTPTVPTRGLFTGSDVAIANVPDIDSPTTLAEPPSPLLLLPALLFLSAPPWRTQRGARKESMSKTALGEVDRHQ